MTITSSLHCGNFLLVIVTEFDENSSLRMTVPTELMRS